MMGKKIRKKGLGIRRNNDEWWNVVTENPSILQDKEEEEGKKKIMGVRIEKENVEEEYVIKWNFWKQ